jgi:hypothetical protein
MALAVLTALNGAQTPVVWYKICPRPKSTSASSGGPPHTHAANAMLSRLEQRSLRGVIQ